MGLSSISRFHLDLEQERDGVVDVFPVERRRYGEAIEARDMKGVRPVLLLQAASFSARRGPGSENRTRFLRRGVAGGVSRPMMVRFAFLTAGMGEEDARDGAEKLRRTRRNAMGRSRSLAIVDDGGVGGSAMATMAVVGVAVG